MLFFSFKFLKKFYFNVYGHATFILESNFIFENSFWIKVPYKFNNIIKLICHSTNIPFIMSLLQNYFDFL